jgi:hypothetical protein
VHERVVHDGGGGGEPACMRIARVACFEPQELRSISPWWRRRVFDRSRRSYLYGRGGTLVALNSEPEAAKGSS